jgi:hypothetical protein
VQLESIEPRYRSDHRLHCCFCWRGFVAGAALANAVTDDGQTLAGHVCPECFSRGAEWLERRLESNAQWAREEAEEQEEWSLEGVSELPTVAEYRLFERLAALD